MGKHDLMKDPYFAEIMMSIESRITDMDREFRDAGTLVPKDSAVKSALRKTELALGGKKPVNPPKDDLEKWTAALSSSLIDLSKELETERGVSKGEFATTLGAVKDSLDTRRELAGTPRGYLDFLEGFIRQVRGA